MKQFAGLAAAFALILCGISARAQDSLTTVYTLGSVSLASDGHGTSDGGQFTYGTNYANTGTLQSAGGNGDTGTYITVAQYDPAAHGNAPLLSVTIQFQGGVTALTFKPATDDFNVNHVGTGATIAAAMQMQLFGPVAAPRTASTATISGITTSDTSGAGPIGITDSSTPAEAWSSFASQTSPVMMTGLGTYSGTGSIYFDIAALDNDTITDADGNNDDTSVFAANATLTIIYNWAPEPGAWAFMVSGAVAGGLFLRKRRTRTRC